MRISTLLSPALTRCRMAARDKETALRELAELLSAQRASLPAESVLQSIQAREKLGPISVGKGVAFPHARIDQGEEFHVVVGLAPDGIDFKSADGLPVRILILFVIPRKHSNLYLQAMAAFLNFFSLEENLARVLEAETPEALMGVFDAVPAPGRTGPTVKTFMEAAPLKATRATPLNDVVTAMGRAHCPSIPVVDGDGSLVGEVRAAALLRATARDVLASLSASLSLGASAPVQRFLAEHGATPVGELAGLVTNGTMPIVQQDEPAAAAAVRLARSGADFAFVLQGRRLVGVLRAVALLTPDGRTHT